MDFKSVQKEPGIYIVKNGDKYPSATVLFMGDHFRFGGSRFMTTKQIASAINTIDWKTGGCKEEDLKFEKIGLLQENTETNKIEEAAYYLNQKIEYGLQKIEELKNDYLVHSNRKSLVECCNVIVNNCKLMGLLKSINEHLNI